jgi:hypothetical protein
MKSLTIKIEYILLAVAINYTPILSAQNNYDGILVQPSTANGTTFYYGEPFEIYFRIVNTKNSVNYYYRPGISVNTRVSLKDIRTGKFLPNLAELMPNHATGSRLERMKTIKPDENRAYQPNEYSYHSYEMYQFFGSDKLSEKKLRHSMLIYKLRAVPVGEYELTFDYDLYPSGKTIKAIHRFKVLELPTKETEAFQRYIRSTEYACKAHFDGDRNYSAKHPDSYDNFIKDYPNSIYANHAFMNMITQSYSYAEGGPSLAERITKFEEYLVYYPKLRNDNLRVLYSAYLPEFIKLIPGKDIKKGLDSFLLKVKDENPEISDMLVRSAMFNHQITGLTNYARADNR